MAHATAFVGDSGITPDAAVQLQAKLADFGWCAELSPSQQRMIFCLNPRRGDAVIELEYELLYIDHIV